MNTLERDIINNYQGGFPISERPYGVMADSLGVTENEVLSCLQSMLDNRQLSRFGPLYHAERMGGALTLAAMKIPSDVFDRVAEIVNSFPEVAHNYEREHEYNMWFVVATEAQDDIQRVLQAIERQTGFPVFNMPKEQEFFIGLRLQV